MRGNDFDLAVSRSCDCTYRKVLDPVVATGCILWPWRSNKKITWRVKVACAGGEACARPLSNRLVQVGLIVATVLVIVAVGFDFLAPLLLDL